MKAIHSLGLLAAVFVASGADAANYSGKVQKVFDKDRRQLSPPPKSLRADEANPDTRYTNGVKRLNKTSKSSSATDEAEELTVDVEEEGEAAATSTSGTATRKRGASTFDGERVLGLGLAGGGAYGVFGAEIDFAITGPWSAGFGVGTGMSYATWSAYGRYYFNQGKINPFFQFGYANWQLGKISAQGSKVQPEFLANRFFGATDGVVTKGGILHLVYPSIGFLFQSQTGLAFVAQLQYLINARDANGALYGGFGFYYYF
jgi:hypothetical protein